MNQSTPGPQPYRLQISAPCRHTRAVADAAHFDQGASMNRRSLLATTAASVVTSVVLSAVRSRALASPASAQSDGLNPPGIRVAGIRMVPVVGGKYKVWTKKIGSGPIKVLVLHGGPGFSHEYLEALESFLPQAGIEMYYYDQ